MTDAQKMLALLRDHPEGVHSHLLRARGISGNPSQRAADLEAKGHKIERKREHRNGRPGTLYKLVGHRAGGRGEPVPENRSRGVSPWKDTPAANAAPSSVSGESRLFESTPSAYDPFSEAA